MEESKLQIAIADWLRQQGYPLEMRTARVFRRRGWFLHQGRRYKDPTLGKERETDVLAFQDDPGIPPLHGRLVIECKWTPKKPWILFGSERDALTPYGHFMSTPMTDSATNALKGIAPEDASDLPLFSDIKEGYALVQAFSKESAIDAAYSAVQAATNAADFFAADMSKSSTSAMLYIPTVVLDGELFRCGLTPEGEVSLQQTDIECLVYIPADNPRMHSVCVHIVQESALDKFIDRAEATFNSLRDSLKKQQRKSET